MILELILGNSNEGCTAMQPSLAMRFVQSLEPGRCSCLDTRCICWVRGTEAVGAWSLADGRASGVTEVNGLRTVTIGAGDIASGYR
jgi:hypothetical protein